MMTADWILQSLSLPLKEGKPVSANNANLPTPDTTAWYYQYQAVVQIVPSRGTNNTKPWY